MNNKYFIIIYGLIITLLIDVPSIFLPKYLGLTHSFFTGTFFTHSLMLVFTGIAIFIFKDKVNYRIAIPKTEFLVKPIVYGLLTFFTVNILSSIIIISLGEKIEGHSLIAGMSPLQIFLFVFLYASIVEEFLFRGFLLNYLSPLKDKGISIFKRKLSLPVLISAIAFGLSHLVLISTGAGALFLGRVVIFTTLMGIIAGYYQEKYDNNVYAIATHMAGNSIVVIAVFLLN